MRHSLAIEIRKLILRFDKTKQEWQANSHTEIGTNRRGDRKRWLYFRNGKIRLRNDRNQIHNSGDEKETVWYSSFQKSTKSHAKIKRGNELCLLVCRQGVAEEGEWEMREFLRKTTQNAASLKNVEYTKRHDQLKITSYFSISSLLKSLSLPYACEWVHEKCACCPFVPSCFVVWADNESCLSHLSFFHSFSARQSQEKVTIWSGLFCAFSILHFSPIDFDSFDYAHPLDPPLFFLVVFVLWVCSLQAMQ